VLKRLLLLSLALAPAIGVHAYSLELVFTDSTGSGVTGGSEITAAPGDLLTLEVRLWNTPGSYGISQYWIELKFDADLDDELDVVDVTESWPEGWANFTEPSIQESSSTQFGRIHDFSADGFSSASSPDAVAFPSTFFPIGVVRFRVNSSLETDGADILSGRFTQICSGGICYTTAICDINGECPSPPPVEFGTASVNAVPEAKTLRLLLLGLVLAIAKRAVHRSGASQVG